MLDVSEVSEIGSYRITVSFNGDVKNYTLESKSKEWDFVVVPKSGMTVLTIEWGEKEFLYDGGVHYPTYVVKDSKGNDVTAEVGSILKFSEGYRKQKELGTYTVKVTLNGSGSEEYFIRSGSTCKYKIVDENGYAPDEDETNGGDGEEDENPPTDIVETLKRYWQAIVSGASIVLILLFTAKGISYASKKKENKRLVESKYKTFYAAAGGGLFGLSNTNWTIIACALMGTAVLALVIMIIEKSGFKEVAEKVLKMQKKSSSAIRKKSRKDVEKRKTDAATKI